MCLLVDEDEGDDDYQVQEYDEMDFSSSDGDEEEDDRAAMKRFKLLTMIEDDGYGYIGEVDGFGKRTYEEELIKILEASTYSLLYPVLQKVDLEKAYLLALERDKPQVAAEITLLRHGQHSWWVSELADDLVSETVVDDLSSDPPVLSPYVIFILEHASPSVLTIFHRVMLAQYDLSIPDLVLIETQLLNERNYKALSNYFNALYPDYIPSFTAFVGVAQQLVDNGMSSEAFLEMTHLYKVEKVRFPQKYFKPGQVGQFLATDDATLGNENFRHLVRIEALPVNFTNDNNASLLERSVTLKDMVWVVKLLSDPNVIIVDKGKIDALPNVELVQAALKERERRRRAKLTLSLQNVSGMRRIPRDILTLISNTTQYKSLCGEKMTESRKAELVQLATRLNIPHSVIRKSSFEELCELVSQIVTRGGYQTKEMTAREEGELIAKKEAAMEAIRQGRNQIRLMKELAASPSESHVKNPWGRD